MQITDAKFEPVWGASAIAKIVFGEDTPSTRRRAFYLLEKGLIPGRKVGGQWVAERGRLQAFLRGEGE